MARERKSEWGGVSLHSNGAQDALKSWFNGLADDAGQAIKANILERVADGRELKLRALFEDKDGKRVEMVRSHTKSGYNISMHPPASTPWV